MGIIYNLIENFAIFNILIKAYLQNDSLLLK